MALLSPSPKSQSQEVGEPVDSSVNWTVRGAAPDVGDAENSATGSVDEVVEVVVVPALTVMRLVSVTVLLGTAELLTVRETVYVPAVLYVYEGL